MRPPLLSLMSTLFLAVNLSAQTVGTGGKAAATITGGDVARRVGIIADDSMLGRDTPSRGLELTAEYVASQFQSFGLRPAGDSSSWFQRYRISRRRLDFPKSRLVFIANGREAVAPFTTYARHVLGPVPQQPAVGPAVFLAGPITPESVDPLDVKGRILLVPIDRAELERPGMQEGLRVLYSRKPRAILLMADIDSTEFARKIPARARERTVIGPPDEPVVVEVCSPPLSRRLPILRLERSRARAGTTATLRELTGLQVRIDMRDSVISEVSVPNTVGMLEGTDPVLRHEYLVYSAHMDHIGITPGRADSINNGADDDASGTAGVVELAEAFSQPGARPKRSVIFLTVSGEEKGLWGSNFFTSHPPVPLKQIVADINIDMIGRNWQDTIVAIGKEHSDLGATLERVNAAHPELRMTAVDDRWPEERFYFRSDHYNFARRGVPVLFFFNGVHEDYHQVTDSPDKIDSEKEARVLRLLFYLGQEIANAPERPKWNPESYREIVED